MVTLSKIYTKTGDKGETSLGCGGKRVPKDDARIHALGTVDELNSILGLVRLNIPETYQKIRDEIRLIQNDLFDCGADICVPDTGEDLGYEPLRMSEGQTKTVEAMIDHWNKDLEPLKSFILPGGSVAASYLHLARTVARRAERDVITLVREADIPISMHIQTYLNRLSDYFFVIGRTLNNNGQDDILWVPGQNR